MDVTNYKLILIIDSYMWWLLEFLIDPKGFFLEKIIFLLIILFLFMIFGVEGLMLL